MKTTFYLILLSLIFASCNPDRVFESHDDNFPSFRWQKDSPVKFTVHMEDTVTKHAISVALRHVYGYQFTTMNIKIDIESPSGKIKSKDYELQVMKNGAYLGDCSLDICDLEVLIEDSVRFFEVGDWNFSITCEIDQPYMANVMEFGLIIDKYPTAE